MKRTQKRTFPCDLIPTASPRVRVVRKQPVKIQAGEAASDDLELYYGGSVKPHPDAVEIQLQRQAEIQHRMHQVSITLLACEALEPSHCFSRASCFHD